MWTRTSLLTAGCVALAFLALLLPLDATTIPPAAITDTPDYAQLVERSSNRAFFTRFLGSSAASSSRGDSSLTRLRSWPAFSQASFEWNVSLKASSSLVTSKLFVAGGVVWALWLDLDGNSTRARAHGHDTVGVMLAASWASGWAEDEVVAVSVRVALPAADKNLPGRMQVPPDVAATLTRNASGMWAADLSRGLLERGLLGGGPDWLLLRLHLLNVTVRWREDGGHPEAAFSRAVREQVSAALGADGYGVREEFDAAVRTAVVVTESEEGTATGAASTYTWRGATYTANAVGELLWWLVHANLQCHGLDERDAYIKMEAVVAACDIRVGRLKAHPKVQVVAAPTSGAVRYLDDQGDDLVRYSLPCRRPDTAGSSSSSGSAGSSSSSTAGGGGQRRSGQERAGYEYGAGGGEGEDVHDGEEGEVAAASGQGDGAAAAGGNEHVSSGSAGTSGAASTAASDWAQWQQLWAEAAAASGRGKPGGPPGASPAGGGVGDSAVLAEAVALLGVFSPWVLAPCLALVVLQQARLAYTWWASGGATAAVRAVLRRALTSGSPAAAASPAEAAEPAGRAAAAGAAWPAAGKRHGGHAPHRSDHTHHGHSGGKLQSQSSGGSEHSHAPPTQAGGRGVQAAGGDRHGRGAASSTGGSAGAGGGKGPGSPPPGAASKRGLGSSTPGQLTRGGSKSARGMAADLASDGAAAAAATQPDAAAAGAGPAAGVGQEGGQGSIGGSGGGGWWSRLWQPRSLARPAAPTQQESVVTAGDKGGARNGAGAPPAEQGEEQAPPATEGSAIRDGKKPAQPQGAEPVRRGTKVKASSLSTAVPQPTPLIPGAADALAEAAAAARGPVGNAAEAATPSVGGSAATVRTSAAGPLRPHTPPPHDSQRQAPPVSAEHASTPAALEAVPSVPSVDGRAGEGSGTDAASPPGAPRPRSQLQPFASDAGAAAAALAAAAAASTASGAVLTPRNSGPLTSISSGSGYGSGPHAPLLSTGGASGGFGSAATAAGSRGRVFTQPWSLAVLAEMAGEAAVGGGPGGGGLGGGAGGLALQYACLMCRDGPREHGFLHGGSVHVGVCGECAGRLVMATAAAGAAAAGAGQGEGGAGAVAGAAPGSGAGCGVVCPVCMQPADRLVEVIL